MILGIVLACFLILGAYFIGEDRGQQKIIDEMSDPTIKNSTRVMASGTLYNDNLNMYVGSDGTYWCSTLELERDTVIYTERIEFTMVKTGIVKWAVVNVDKTGEMITLTKLEFEGETEEGNRKW